MTSTDDDLLAELQRSVAAPETLTARLGIEFLRADPENVTARMPVAGNTQVIGLLHGGASAALAETVGSVAATLHAGPGRAAVGVELSATHHRAVRAGFVTAVATPLHRGGRLATYEIAVTDDDGRRVCTSRLTCMLVSREG
ncbi:PaaI family thioesterase [Georgenia sunbinii]|uniref:PaaI family thioesterase n=1 Tax=Georgenia sunbinii TaxID=3117728 RepID=UPI002F267996